MDDSDNTFEMFVPKNTLSKYLSKWQYKMQNSAANVVRKIFGLNRCQASMVINSDGTCNLCCWDYKSKYVVGTLKRNISFMDIWNSKTASRDRRLAKNKKLSMCKNCPDYSIIDYDSFRFK